MHLLNCEETVKSYYTYVVYYNGLNRCVQLMFKAVDDRDFSSVYNSFRPISAKGIALDTITYPCEDNASWNDKTREYYHSLKDSDKISWGIFADNIDTDPLKSKIPRHGRENRLQVPHCHLLHGNGLELSAEGCSGTDRGWSDSAFHVPFFPLDRCRGHG